MYLRIKEILKQRGMTAKELAETININRVTLVNIVNEKSNPSFDTLVNIANALGVSVGELFDRPKDGVIVCPNCGAPIELHPTTKGE